MTDTSSLDLSPLSLGSDSVYSRLSFEAAVQLVKTALENGINTFDISYYRSFPHNEVVFGRVLQTLGVKRGDYRIIEKVWLPTYPQEPLGDQLEKSLNRLGIEYADVVLVESPRPHTDPRALARETAEIVKSNLALNWGMLNWTADQLLDGFDETERHNLPAPRLAQIKYSVVRRSVVEGDEYVNALDKSGMMIHAADTIEAGILAGKPTTAHSFVRDSGNIRDQIRAAYPRFEEVARKLSAKPAQVAIAFCLTNKRVASVVFGATMPWQILENVEAIKLAREKREELTELLADFAIPGHVMDGPMEFTEVLPPHFVA